MGPPYLALPYFYFFFFHLSLFGVGMFRGTCGPEGPTSLNPSPCVCLFDFYFWMIVEGRWRFP